VRVLSEVVSTEAVSEVSEDPAVRVRHSLEKLPRWITRIGETVWGTRIHSRPSRRRSPAFRLMTALAMMAFGITLGVIGLVIFPWGVPLIPIGWVFTIGGGRYLQVVIGHHAVHNRFFRHARANRALVQTITVALLIQDFDGYFKDHVLTHHALQQFARRGDPDLEALIAFGFKPGMSKAALWRRLRRSLVSPAFHLAFAEARMHSNFVTAPPLRRVAAVMFCALVATLLILQPALIAPTVVIVFIPLTVGYQASALLQFTSEHLWMLPCREGETLRQHAAALTRGRFCGDAAPSPDLRGRARIAGWTRWWVRLFTIHAMVRIAVLPGDLVDHDLHHLAPGRLDWANSSLDRLEMNKDDKYELTEVWGLGEAIDTVFEVLSALPEEPVEAASSSKRHIFGSM
jgi:hypothetical protein